MFTAEDKKFMQRALELAEKGAGFVSPNPLVGAVVVKDGEIVGEGYHARYGESHAEPQAIEEAGRRAQGADLYVNLEPCSHYGNTPPCSLKLINSGISRVLIANQDPNPVVDGSGIEMLKARGIKVESGLLEEEGQKLNEAFFLAQSEGRAFINLKSAQTLDGYLAAPGGDARWITGPEARSYGHRLRHRLDAVMVGIGTVLADNPRLTARDYPGEKSQPARVVLDPQLRFPLEARMLKEQEAGDIFIFIGEKEEILNSEEINSSEEKEYKMQKLGDRKGVSLIELPLNERGYFNPEAVTKILAGLDLISVLLEGGSQINYSFQRAGLIDKYYFFLAPRLMAGSDGVPVFQGPAPGKISRIQNLKIEERRILGEDLLLVAYPGKEEGRS